MTSFHTALEQFLASLFYILAFKDVSEKWRLFFILMLEYVSEIFYTLSLFQILISMLVNWGLCGILTMAGVFTDNKNDVGYNSRTDARIKIVSDNPWFIYPYPGTWI